MKRCTAILVGGWLAFTAALAQDALTGDFSAPAAIQKRLAEVRSELRDLPTAAAPADIKTVTNCRITASTAARLFARVSFSLSSAAFSSSAIFRRDQAQASSHPSFIRACTQS